MRGALKLALCLTPLVFASTALLNANDASAAARVATSDSADMPSGIMLRAIRVGPQATERLIFAGTTGLPFYTFQRDEPGKSMCVAECAKAWPPALAPARARAFGNWSIVKREDGMRQWAFRGKPLYTFVKDAPVYTFARTAGDIKEVPTIQAAAAAAAAKIQGAALTGTPKKDAQADSATATKDAPKSGGVAAAAAPKVDAAGEGLGGVWSVAAVDSSSWLPLIAGVSVSEVVAAPGQVLISEKGAPLYVYSGKTDRPLPEEWAPVPAAQIDLPVGDFSVVSRPDGSPQWAFRGMPLYTFKRDVEVGDLNGRGLVPGMNPAVIFRYFLPPQVAVRSDERRGGVLVEAKTGQTLYARDRAIWNARAAHYARGETRGVPETGVSIGTTGCDAACEKIWQPLLAPRNAQPASYWSVLDREDGKRQWAYRGFPLYTRVGETPGHVLHHDTYDLAINHQTAQVYPANRGWALYWRAAVP